MIHGRLFILSRFSSLLDRGQVEHVLIVAFSLHHLRRVLRRVFNVPFILLSKDHLSLVLVLDIQLAFKVFLLVVIAIHLLFDLLVIRALFLRFLIEYLAGRKPLRDTREFLVFRVELVLV